MVELLRRQDAWARTPKPSEEAVKRLVEDPPATLREAMRLLNYGPVADYFAYRWSDPTYLSGLALLNMYRHTNVLELACGIGHYCRELSMRGIPVTGADVVYSKLWLAKNYVAPEANFVCLDAGAPLPFPDKHFSTAFCHDAFYFLPNKQHVASELRRVAHTVLIGHTHNKALDNYSAGDPLTIGQYAELFPGTVIYNDAELTRALLQDRPPQPSRSGAALAFAPPSREWTGQFTQPLPSEPLRRNPLLVNGKVVFPSDRYREEYGPLMGYLTDPTMDAVRRRAYVSLPERW